MPKKILILILMLAGGLFYIFTSADIIGYTVYEPHSQTIDIQEEIPFEIEQEYVEEEMVTEEVCEKQVIPYSVRLWDGIYNYSETIADGVAVPTRRAECYVVIENLGDLEGEWTVGMYFQIGDQRYDQQPITKKIPSKQMREFRWALQYVDATQHIYCDTGPIVKEPVIEVCKEVEVTKPVVKTKRVMVTKDVGKEVLISHNKTYIKYKYVNRFFGYEQPFYLSY